MPYSHNQLERNGVMVDNYLAVLLFSFTTMITPGPNNIMIMSSGLNYGVRKSMPHYLGICLGFPAMVVAVGLGFDALFQEFPFLHEVIKVAGVLYLLYLAYHVAMAPVSNIGVVRRNPLTFLQAAVFQWVNPKAWIMATGAVAAYTTIDSDMFLQVVYITFAFFLATFPCIAIWLFLGTHLKKLLRNETHQRLFNVTMAILLVLSVIPVIIELASDYLA
ncbi:LysE family translocator [Endozoicomonas montiporae]|uniref:LysE family translocator n=1 Tax=Endozoicomonas montiporae TaxID=1027273 RepID=UPI001F2AEF68|nr:LysE family translocator [Endozoicomonas montiporae]